MPTTVPLWQTDSLSELEDGIWATLGRVPAEVHHPWSLPVLGSISPNGPEARTVVLRSVDRAWRRFVAYSDARAAKVAELRADSRVQWHFYDPRERVQLRARGTAAIEHNTGYSRAFWEQVPEANRAHYQTMGVPGATVPEPAHGHIFAPGSAENFAVIVATIRELDWLWLATQGHRRARFIWTPDGGWKGSWTVP